MEKAIDLVRDIAMEAKPYISSRAVLNIFEVSINIIFAIGIHLFFFYLLYIGSRYVKRSIACYIDRMNEKRNMEAATYEYYIQQRRVALEKLKSEEGWKQKQIENRYQSELEYEKRFRQGQ